MNRFLKAGPYVAREFLEAKYGKGGIVDAIKGAMKMTDAAPDPSRRKAIGLREKIIEPGSLTTIEKEVSASDLDTLQKAMGNVGQAILNEPVSRREVLKRGALSTASNLIPGGGVLQQVAKEIMPQALETTRPVASVVKKAASPRLSLQALIAKALKEDVGEDVEDIIEYVIKQNPRLRPRTEDGMEALEARVLDMMYPDNFDVAGIYRESPGPLGLMKDMMSMKPKQNVKQVFRQVKQVNPEHYEALKKSARDIHEFLSDVYDDFDDIDD